MAWTTPMTAVANTPFTAADYNQQIRDNMRCQAPYVTDTAGDTYVVRSANTIVSTGIEYAEVLTSQTTTSTTYTDLATSGPSITISGGILGQQAMVWISAEMDNNTLSLQTSCAVEVSGASSYAASDTRCAITRDGLAATNPSQYMGAFLYDPINRGASVTFTMKYRVGGGTGTFVNRRIMVWPL